MRFFGFNLNRTVCDVFTDMRKINTTNNGSDLSKALLLSLIEEGQVMGNRMEAALYDKHDREEAREHIKELKAEIKKLEKRKDALNEDTGSSEA